MEIISSGSAASLFSVLTTSIFLWTFLMDIRSGRIGMGLSSVISDGSGRCSGGSTVVVFVAAGGGGGGGGEGPSSGSFSGSPFFEGVGTGGKVGGGTGKIMGTTLLLGFLQGSVGNVGSIQPNTPAANVSSAVGGKVYGLTATSAARMAYRIRWRKMNCRSMYRRNYGERMQPG